MKRRRFLAACALAGTLSPQALQAMAEAPPKRYARVLLTDQEGEPIRPADLQARVNYLFHYPYIATPCFLLDLARPVSGRAGLKARGGESYRWAGGVGPKRSIVAFSAICAHRLVYPTREISFIRYQQRKSATSESGVIHCCADHSIYDPTSGAAVVRGPAEHPLAAIILEYDPGRDELYALGTQGAEQFDAFFEKYAFRLATEYGASRARLPVEGATPVTTMQQYCRQTVEC